MFLGHYAAALGAKKLAPRLSLGTLFAAAAFLDLVWPFLVFAGLEVVRIDPGATAFTPLDFAFYPYSHSLLAAAAWAILFALAIAFYAVGAESRAALTPALVVAALVLSHWGLDALSHRPDLPITPWNTARVGLGLWNSVPATLAVELALFAAGVWIYMTAVRPMPPRARWYFAGFIVLLLGIYAGAAFGPPPPSPAAVAGSALAQWLFVAAAWAVDRRARIS